MSSIPQLVDSFIKLTLGDCYPELKTCLPSHPNNENRAKVLDLLEQLHQLGPDAVDEFTQGVTHQVTQALGPEGLKALLKLGQGQLIHGIFQNRYPSLIGKSKYAIEAINYYEGKNSYHESLLEGFFSLVGYPQLAINDFGDILARGIDYLLGDIHEVVDREVIKKDNEVQEVAVLRPMLFSQSYTQEINYTHSSFEVIRQAPIPVLQLDPSIIRKKVRWVLEQPIEEREQAMEKAARELSQEFSVIARMKIRLESLDPQETEQLLKNPMKFFQNLRSESSQENPEVEEKAIHFFKELIKDHVDQKIRRIEQKRRHLLIREICSETRCVLT